jgi:(p)ppGpp synthase/HD superfamily hydrolase
MEESEKKMELIEKAIEFAANAHVGTFRKGSKTPYITHPFNVAKLLINNVDSNKEEDLICAGLLHDTVEDTEIMIETIEKEFGPHVAQLVASDSEDKSLPWEKRKQHTIDFLKNEATHEMQLLACADKLDNIRNIKNDYEVIGDEVWERFIRGKEKQAWYYKGIRDSLTPLEGLLLYREYCDFVDMVFD